MQYKKNITLLSFPMADHIQYERLPGQRQDGINFSDKGIPIEELTEDEANQYGEFLKWSFIAQYKEAKGML
jgi:hypothetical protein